MIPELVFTISGIPTSDSIDVPEGSYAKILLANGTKIELGGGTRLTVLGEGWGIQFVMDSGAMGFAGVRNQPLIVTPCCFGSADRFACPNRA